MIRRPKSSRRSSQANASCREICVRFLIHNQPNFDLQHLKQISTLVDEKLWRRAGGGRARGRGEEKSVWNFFALFRRRWEFASFINSRYSRPSPLDTVTTTTGSCDTFSAECRGSCAAKDLNRVRLLKRKLMRNIFFVNINQNYTWN